MVLTGKQALDYSGGVSAEDNFGIGGYERIMGPNGQAQYWAPDLAGACRVLLDLLRAHLRRAGRALPPPRARRPIPSTATSAAPRTPPRARISRTVGDIFSDETNPGRKQAVRHPLGDARGDRRRPPAARALGRRCATPRSPSSGTRTSAAGPSRCSASSRGRCRATALIPADGPEQWTSGTLFPRSSKKIARAINAATRPPAARRAGQPRGLRRLARVDARVAARVRRRDRPRGRQLRRADRLLRRLALPRRRVRRVLAAAQRAARDGRARGRARLGHRRRAGGRGRVRARRRRRPRARDQRIVALDERIAARRRAPSASACAPSARRCGTPCCAEKLGELAARFDAVHSVERAVRMGSVSRDHPAGVAAPVPDRGRRARHAAHARPTRRPSDDGRRAGSPARSLTSRATTPGSARASASVLAGLRVREAPRRLAAGPLDGQGGGRRRGSTSPPPRSRSWPRRDGAPSRLAGRRAGAVSAIDLSHRGRPRRWPS